MANLPINVKKNAPSTKGAESTKEQLTISPPVDIYETKEEMVMIIDVPGVAKDNLHVKVDNGIISITGETSPSVVGDLRYWEFSPCKFHRAFELSPEIDQEKIFADFKQGELTIHMPKAAKAKPRQITVNVK